MPGTAGTILIVAGLFIMLTAIRAQEQRKIRRVGRVVLGITLTLIGIVIEGVTYIASKPPIP